MINYRSVPDNYLQQIILKVTRIRSETHWFVWAPIDGVPWVIANNCAPIWIDLIT